MGGFGHEADSTACGRIWPAVCANMCGSHEAESLTQPSFALVRSARCGDLCVKALFSIDSHQPSAEHIAIGVGSCLMSICFLVDSWHRCLLDTTVVPCFARDAFSMTYS